MTNMTLTEQEKKYIKDIISEYRQVSSELTAYEKKAEEINDKVFELSKNLQNIKDKEKVLMSELHDKYGEFSIQDIYYAIQ